MSTLPLATATAESAPLANASPETDLWQRFRSKVSERTAFAIADQVVYSFGNMVVAALLSRHCGQRQFGVYILTQRTMDVLIQLCNVFLWAPFTFNVASTGEEQKARYSGSIFSLQVFFCILFSGLVWGAGCWAGHVGKGDFQQTFAPLTLAGAGILFREFTRRMYFALLRMQEAFWTDVVTVFLQIAGVLWLAISHHLTVPNTLYILCGAASVVSAWWMVRDGVRLRVEWRGILADSRENLKLGRWFLGSNMVFLASSQCNPWVLGSLLGGPAVASYAVCESVVNIPRVALTSMQNIMGPMIARAHADEGRSGVRKAVRGLDRQLLFGSALLAIAILLCGPTAAVWIFKAVPANARLLLGLLSVNLVAYAATLAQSYGLTALGRADVTVAANGVGLLAQAAVCLPLIHRFGTAGAAGAMLFGTIAVLLVRQWLYMREMGTA